MSERRAELWMVLLSIVAGAPALFGEFVLDDTHAVVGSACVRGDVSVAELWRRNFWCELPVDATVDAWRPWPVMVWRILWLPSGGHPAAFHAFGLALHAAVALVVRRIVADWGRSLDWAPERIARRSLLAGLAFAAAAVHAEAIASVVAHADLWAALGTARVLHVAFSRPRGGWIELGAWAAIAMLSKETSAVVVPVLAAAALVAHRTGERSVRRRLLGATVLVGLVVAAYVGVRWASWGLELDAHTTAMVNPLVDQPWVARPPTALSLLGRGLWLSVVGFPLSADYSAHAITVGVFDGWTVLGVAFVTVLLGLLWRQRRSARAVAWIGGYLGWWLLLGHLLVPLPSLFSERLLYGPSVALIVLLASLAPVRESGPRARRVGLALIGGWIGVQLLLCAEHSRAWTTERRITARTVAHSPHSVRAHIWRARVLLRDGDPSRAEELARHVDTAIELEPGLAVPHAFRGVLLDLQGQPETALGSFRRAFETDPADPEVTDLFIQFLLRYGHEGPARSVYAAHAQARGGRPHPTVHAPASGPG